MTDRCWDTDPRVRSTAGYGVAGGESVTVPEEGSLQKRQRRWWWRALAVLTPPVCPGPLRRPRDGLEVKVIMDAEGSMSSASGVESSLVPVLFPSKKGGEIALPTCVHCHVAKSTGANNCIITPICIVSCPRGAWRPARRSGPPAGRTSSCPSVSFRGAFGDCI